MPAPDESGKKITYGLCGLSNLKTFTIEADEMIGIDTYKIQIPIV